jgi:predicted nucleic acid-binding protein
VKLIVADTSPLIVVARSRLVPVLKQVAEEVVLPATVYAECTLDMGRPGAQAIRAAVVAGKLAVHPDVHPSRLDVEDETPALDEGERAAIALAQALGCPLLIDERHGRQAALRGGLTVIGSLGILLEAKRRGAIPAVAPIVQQWRAWGYFLSESLVKAVLERAGEA